MDEDTIRSTIVSVIIEMIVIPLALGLSFISLLITLSLLSMGAWVISIPFVLTMVLGVYFVYLHWPSKELGEVKSR